MNTDRENRIVRLEGRVTYADAIELLELQARLRKLAGRITYADARALLWVTHAAEAAYEPGSVVGVSDVCMDCGGVGKIFIYPASAPACDPVLHGPGCPAASGAVTWRPAAEADLE